MFRLALLILAAGCSEQGSLAGALGLGGAGDASADLRVIEPPTDAQRPAPPPADAGADAGCPAEPEVCYSGRPETLRSGPCRAGVRTCGPDGGATGCDGEVLPALEACNQIDDDCDGIIDEAIAASGQRCRQGVGACTTVGGLACVSGALVCDAVQGPPGEERCNGADDDCDGRTDEGQIDCGCADDGDCLDEGVECTRVRCVDEECLREAAPGPCDDGLFCNGADACDAGRCVPGGQVVCAPPTQCSEAAGRCVQCQLDADCGARQEGPWGPCRWDDPCPSEGNRERTVRLPRCVDGVCAEEAVRDVQGCQLYSDGAPCPGGICQDNACVEEAGISLTIGGLVMPNGRLTARCERTGESCTAEGTGDRCLLACPAESLVSICCGNGSASCGGSPADRRPGVPNIHIRTVRLPVNGCPGPLEADAVRCQAMMSDQAPEVICEIYR